MAPKKRQRPGKESMNEESNEPQDTNWTHKEKTSRSDFERIIVHPTRFVDRFFLRQMGLAEGVDDLLQRIGMSCLKDMYYPTFEEETKDFLSTVKVEYKDPKDKVASQGLMTFKIGNKGYGLTIFDICEVYGFNKGEAVSFDTFHGASDLWNRIANGNYRTNGAKMTGIRNPVIRYVCKLLANTFFARKDAGAVTLKELCLLYQGLKHLLIDMRGVLLEYEFGDEINYGSIFASNLLQFRKWAETTTNPDLYIGGMLTPLFEKAGVDLSNSRELPDMAYLGRDYLIISRFLKATSDLNALHYNIQLRDKTKRIFVLPQPDKTNILTLTNVKFEVGEEDLLQEDQGPMGLRDSDGEGAAEPRDYLDELNMIQMPDIEFTARTKREKLIQAAYKAQRKINEIQKKLLAKLFRKVKKLQPPDYVSSEDEAE
ncbi:hypothetical protein ISN45_Aa07g034960 [Arabidopsis thaliana x Arabidopsis arenosa]|uniref:Arabidopsis retrotransposon Orf1 C-terminal domain-containing protein n=1 Tax=Arabidopsis thaliana x Arabidopsis arenosa TaxID=1240361 RepID=A0A8T1YBX0_9BRAS|nr:hypothetical protein ISN45_Aa07g034960 [Arabidopsis thaliana x Arabidopsis arenosa]